MFDKSLQKEFIILLNNRTNFLRINDKNLLLYLLLQYKLMMIIILCLINLYFIMTSILTNLMNHQIFYMSIKIIILIIFNTVMYALTMRQLKKLNEKLLNKFLINEKTGNIKRFYDCFVVRSDINKVYYTITCYKVVNELTQKEWESIPNLPEKLTIDQIRDKFINKQQKLQQKQRDKINKLAIDYALKNTQ